jgi:hypothetical protein
MSLSGSEGRSSRTWRHRLAALTVVASSLVLVLQERVTGAAVSGQNNAVVVPSLAVLAVGVVFLVRLFARHSLTRLLGFATPILLIVVLSVGRGDATEMARYLLTYLLAVAWLRLLDLGVGPTGRRPVAAFALRTVLIAGIVMGVVWASDGRMSGFAATSPTVFAYVMLVAGIGLAAWSRSPWDHALVALGLPFLVAAQSRSSTALALILALVWLARPVLRRRTAASVAVGLLILVAIGGGVSVAAYSEMAGAPPAGDALRTVWREGSQESTATRLGIYRAIVSEFDTITLFFGGGAGHAFELVSERLDQRVPPHLDGLTLLADFGLLSLALLLAVAVARTVRHPPSWGQLAVAFAYLASGQLHNLLFSPLGVVATVTAWHLARVRQPRS